jgi:hypothetical protein
LSIINDIEDSDRAMIVETLERFGWNGLAGTVWLERFGWIIGGPRGAAAKLGLKRTTLQKTWRSYEYLHQVN